MNSLFGINHPHFCDKQTDWASRSLHHQLKKIDYQRQKILLHDGFPVGSVKYAELFHGLDKVVYEDVLATFAMAVGGQNATKSLKKLESIRVYAEDGVEIIYEVDFGCIHHIVFYDFNMENVICTLIENVEKYPPVYGASLCRN